MMLQHVLQSAVDRHLLTTARVGPMRTAVKQFSAMFGVTPEQLAPEQYHLPKDALFRFIEHHSAQDVGPSKLRNTKNNIRFLLDLAVREGWLRSMGGDSLTWRERHRTGRLRAYRTRTDGSRVNTGVYALLLPAATPPEATAPAKNHASRFKPYQLKRRQGLQVAPQAFLDEITAYLDWCQKAHAPGRDAKIKKRAATAADRRNVLLRIGGYAHHIAGIPLEEITLDRLTQPDFVEQFVGWWVNERRGRVTITIHCYLHDLQVVARHWLEQPERADALIKIEQSLVNEQGPVYEKEPALVPLRTIEDVGLRNYPFTAERLQRRGPLRGAYRHVQDPTHRPLPDEYGGHTLSWKTTGSQVMVSLIIRLLVRLPMRQRCIREMRLGHNLRHLPDGSWEVKFSGAELKIGSRKRTGVNVYQHAVPTELTGLIDEWVTVWRPLRLPEQGSNLVFLNQEGRPLEPGRLNGLFISAVYRYTGIRTTIHMIRDSWASDYLDSTGDVAGCADMLGDTVEMVLRHYAHVLKRRAQGRTASWLQTHLGAAD